MPNPQMRAADTDRETMARHLGEHFAAGRLTARFDGARQPEPWHPLSAREFEIAQLVAAGLTNRQIAQQLILAPKTISAHVTHILAKLGAARRAEIAAWCATVRQATHQGQ